MSNKKSISYSAMKRFCTCRKSFYFRYILRIEPLYVSDALSFGKLIHSCLEAWYNFPNGDKGWSEIIDENYLDRKSDKKQAHYHALAFALMDGYSHQYKYDDFDVVATEVEYTNPIINPLTGRKSRKYNVHGFIDMVIQRDDGIWLVEHKTAATLNAGYIERLWHDLQIMLYAIEYEYKTGKKVRGILYNIIQKAQLRLKQNETIEEFTLRLKERYLTDKSLFHREEILVDNLRLDEVKTELWQVTQDVGSCKDFYKNRSQCYVFGECEFFKICNSGDNPLIIENYYKERENDTITDGKKQEENQPF